MKHIFLEFHSLHIRILGLLEYSNKKKFNKQSQAYFQPATTRTCPTCAVKFHQGNITVPPNERSLPFLYSHESIQKQMIQFAVSFYVLSSRACPLQEGGKAKANSYLIVIPRPLEKNPAGSSSSMPSGPINRITK